MDGDQLMGKMKQLKGEIKQHRSKITDDDLTKIESKRDYFEGKIQERYGKTKDGPKEELDQFFIKHQSRNNIYKKYLNSTFFLSCI